MRTARTTACTLLGLLALGLGGCEMAPQQVPNPWIGTTDAFLMASRGAPDRESTAGGGFRVLTYVDVLQLPLSGQSLICRRNFTVDDGHRIVAATYYCN